MQVPDPEEAQAEVLLVRVKVDPEARAAAREGDGAWLQQHGGSRKRAREAMGNLKQEEPQ